MPPRAAGGSQERVRIPVRRGKEHRRNDPEHEERRHARSDEPEYHDRWIDCTHQELRIRGYYFPWGTKRIPYGKLAASAACRSQS